MLSSQQLPGRMASTSHEADLEPLTGWENSTAFGAAQSGAYLSLGASGARFRGQRVEKAALWESAQPRQGATQWLVCGKGLRC